MPRYDLTNRNKSTHKKIRSLSFVVTKDCNLRCSYCYEKHEQRETEIMDVSIAQEAITRYMEQDDGYDAIMIDFFGGEPMLGFPFIRDVVQWVDSRKWKKPHRFMIGTNGTILTHEMKEWLEQRKDRLVVGISIDGNKTAHDLCRDNSYDRLIQNLPFFTRHWPDQPAKMTISKETIPHIADSVIHLEETQVYFSANVGFEDFWGDNPEKQQLLDIYEAQLDRLVDYYAQRPELYPVSPLLTAVPEYLGLPRKGTEIKNNNPRYCGAGHEMAVVDLDGKTYSCHRFLPWVTGQPNPPQNANCQTAWAPEECAQCKLIHSCPTCAGFNWETNRDTAIRTTFHCQSFKREVLASSKLAAIRLSQKLSQVDNMSPEEKGKTKKRLEALWELMENGI